MRKGPRWIRVRVGGKGGGEAQTSAYGQGVVVALRG
jgi:hypothetical protein